MRKNLLVLILIVLIAGQSCIQKSESSSKTDISWYSKELVEVENGFLIPAWANDAKIYDAPVPEWAKEDLPDWIEPHIMKQTVKNVAGIDRYHSYFRIRYNEKTAKFLYENYTPVKVNYIKGVLSSYEAIVNKYVSDIESDKEKAIRLLTEVMPVITKHPSNGLSVPCSLYVPGNRAFDDEQLLADGILWCNEQARVFMRLCQVAGIPARYVFLGYSEESGGGAHVVTEFYADGHWSMADASDFFVHPHPDGHLLSAAECHDGGEGQKYAEIALRKKFRELSEESDENLGCTAEKNRRRFRELSESDINRYGNFEILNYNLPVSPKNKNEIIWRDLFTFKDNNWLSQKMVPAGDRMIPEWAEESKFYGAPIPPWVKVDLPAWVEPFVRKLYVEGVAGIDRYHAYSSVPYCEETAKFLYEQYTPITVDYKKGTLPAYEILVQKHVSGLKSDREKAVHLLTKVVPVVAKHPTIPPCGEFIPGNRGLSDEELLVSGDAWCNEQSRLFVRLCQVAGIPARMIFLNYSEKAAQESGLSSHVISEFYAEGRWSMVDPTFSVVFPHPDGHLMSAAECHDGGEGQALAQQHYEKRYKEIDKSEDKDFGCDPVTNRKSLNKLIKVALYQLDRFQVMNYPLPD